nr:hypothetical protein [Actinomycetota bacterium]
KRAPAEREDPLRPLAPLSPTLRRPASLFCGGLPVWLQYQGQSDPEFVEVQPGRLVACWNWEEGIDA